MITWRTLSMENGFYCRFGGFWKKWVLDTFVRQTLARWRWSFRGFWKCCRKWWGKTVGSYSEAPFRLSFSCNWSSRLILYSWPFTLYSKERLGGRALFISVEKLNGNLCFIFILWTLKKWTWILWAPSDGGFLGYPWNLSPPLLTFSLCLSGLSGKLFESA